MDIVTGSVDGSPFIGEEWNSGRTRFWGFGPDQVGPRELIDLTIEVTGSSGQTAQLPLSSFSYLQPQIVTIIRKASFMNVGGSSPSESVFQSFEFPLSAFVEINPALDPASLVMVRFIFDRTPEGVIVLDDFGFRDNVPIRLKSDVPIPQESNDMPVGI